MAEAKVNTFFISEKVSKIRWLHEYLRESERFVTGTWDMPQNFVRLWRLEKNKYADEYNDCVPKCYDKIQFNGDVTGLELVKDDGVLASCSDGHVSVLFVNRGVEEDSIELHARSKLLHKFDISGDPAPCTAISLYDKEMATVGEDGRLNILDVDTLGTPRYSIEADSCSLMTVAYVNPQEVLTANRMGVIRMFDARTSDECTATNAFMTSCEDDKRSNYVSSLVSHPTQQHIVLAGSEEGSITVWDLRQPGLPASYLSAHTSAITEIRFHHSDPTKLFTASEYGELWLWQHSSMSGLPDALNVPSADNVNPWLNGERAKNRISVTSIISDLRKSINSFDCVGSKLICGSDTEAIYFIDNVV